MASLGIFPVRDFDGFEIDGPTGQASDGRARDHGTERAPAAGVGNERTDGSGPRRGQAAGRSRAGNYDPGALRAAGRLWRCGLRLLGRIEGRHPWGAGNVALGIAAESDHGRFCEL